MSDSNISGFNADLSAVQWTRAYLRLGGAHPSTASTLSAIAIVIVDLALITTIMQSMLGVQFVFS